MAFLHVFEITIQQKILPLVLNVESASNSTISLLFAPYTVTFMPIVVGLCFSAWQECYVMLCYVIWLFVKRLSQEAIQRRSQRDRLVKIKVFKLRRDADDMPC